MIITAQFADMTSLSFFFFLTLLGSFVKFTYWSKFYVNIIAGSGVMTIFFYKGLTRRLEIENTLVWVLPNIWRLEKVRNQQGSKITPLPARLRINITSTRLPEPDSQTSVSVIVINTLGRIQNPVKQLRGKR